MAFSEKTNTEINLNWKEIIIQTQFVKYIRVGVGTYRPSQKLLNRLIGCDGSMSLLIRTEQKSNLRVTKVDTMSRKRLSTAVRIMKM
jgi:hypothetical protein